jgi:hypothetical protein
MKNVLGFCAKKEVSPAAEARELDAARAVRSVAEVRFPDGPVYPYYNDRFDLQPGDAVFVSGKMAGKLGIVQSVTTQFKIHLAQYQRVVARPDFRLSGTFEPAAGMMVCPGGCVPDTALFRSWVRPPREEDDELVCGEGHCFELAHPELAPGLDEARLGRAVDYCREGRVRYLRLAGGAGIAFVEGEEWYEVEFRFDGAELSEMYCDCPCPGLCKHELAAALVLRAILDQRPDLQDFTAVEQGFFWHVISHTRQRVTV